MHPVIREFPSLNFYGGNLKDGPTVEQVGGDGGTGRRGSGGQGGTAVGEREAGQGLLLLHVFGAEQS